MTALRFNAMHAAVDPRGVLIRDYLNGVGESHGRDVAGMVLSTASLSLPGTAEAARAVIENEMHRMVLVYAEAGCSRRQLRAFIVGFVRGATARVHDAEALAVSAVKGSG